MKLKKILAGILLGTLGLGSVSVLPNKNVDVVQAYDMTSPSDGTWVRDSYGNECKLLARYNSNWISVLNGEVSTLFDGNVDTGMMFSVYTNNETSGDNHIQPGDYVGLEYNTPVDISKISFTFTEGACFTQSKLQYRLENSSDWVDIDGAVYEDDTVIEKEVELTGVSAVRLIDTQTDGEYNNVSRVVKIKEIDITTPVFVLPLEAPVLKVDAPMVGGTLADVTYGDYIAPAVQDKVESPAVLTTEKLVVQEINGYQAFKGRVTAANSVSANEKFDVYGGNRPLLMSFKLYVPSDYSVSSDAVIMGKTDNQYGIQLAGTTLKFYANTPGQNNAWPQSSATITKGEWNDIIAVYTADSGLCLFVGNTKGNVDRAMTGEGFVQNTNCSFAIGYNNSKYNANNSTGQQFTGYLADVKMYVDDAVPTVGDTTTADEIRTKLVDATPMFDLGVVGKGTKPNYTITNTSWTGNDGNAITSLDVTGTNTIVATLEPADGYCFDETSKPQTMTFGESTVNVTSSVINNDGTMTVTYQFNGSEIYAQFKASASTFLGGSLRKTYVEVDEQGNISNSDDYANYDKTSIRFGYELNPIEGYTLDSWSWKWGLSDDNLTGSVPGNNSLPTTDKTDVLTSNLVIQNVPKDYYDDSIYAQLILVYTNDETGNEVVVDTKVVNRDIKSIAKKAVEEPILEGDDVYAQKILSTLNSALLAEASTDNTIGNNHYVKYVNDGDESSDFQSNGQWPTKVVLEWEADCSVSEVIVKIGGASGEEKTRTVDVVVEYLSNDSGEYIEFGSGTSPVYSDIEFSSNESITAKSIRVTLQNPHDDDNATPRFWASIKEIEVY